MKLFNLQTLPCPQALEGKNKKLEDDITKLQEQVHAIETKKVLELAVSACIYIYMYVCIYYVRLATHILDIVMTVYMVVVIEVTLLL